MAVVQLYLQTATEYGHLFTIDEDRIRQYSALIDDTLGDNSASEPPTKIVELQGAAPAALQYILERIKNNKTPRSLHIKVHDLGLEKAVAIYQAANLLKLQPHQPHIEGYIVGYISHKLITPGELVTMHHCFVGRQDTCKAWKVMVHQVAWNLVHSKYAYDEALELKMAAMQYPGLVQAVDERVNELIAKADHYAQMKALEAARKQKKRSSSQS